MEVTFTERKAIEGYIAYIQEERARLTADHNLAMSRLLDEYKTSLTRLSKLDEVDNIHPAQQQAAPLTATPADEIVALVNKRDGEEIPSTSMNLQEAIERHNAEANAETGTTEYDRQKELLKDYDYKNQSVKTAERKSSYRDVRIITQEIVTILKEAGTPVKTGKIIKILKERGYNMSSPYALINQAKGYDPKIQPASFGYYQYKW